MDARRPLHAGSWYTSSSKALRRQLDGMFAEADRVAAGAVRIVVAPHAGISFSGPTAARAYAQLDPDSVRRVVILGPSHHVYYPNCVVSTATHLETPLGRVAVDRAAADALCRDKLFSPMDRSEDEEEHSIEMHLPFLQHAMGDRAFTVVPIVVGALSQDGEKQVGDLIRPFLEDDSTVLAVSTDFCHWGARFRYQHYNSSKGPIFRSIEWLDKEGMRALEEQDPAAFAAYLAETKNTICGRHPLAAVLHALQGYGRPTATRFVHYAQSNKCESMSDSSVSYAAGYTALEADEGE